MLVECEYTGLYPLANLVELIGAALRAHESNPKNGVPLSYEMLTKSISNIPTSISTLRSVLARAVPEDGATITRTPNYVIPGGLPTFSVRMDGKAYTLFLEQDGNCVDVPIDAFQDLSGVKALYNWGVTAHYAGKRVTIVNDDLQIVVDNELATFSLTAQFWNQRLDIQSSAECTRVVLSALDPA